MIHDTRDTWNRQTESYIIRYRVIFLNALHGDSMPAQKTKTTVYLKPEVERRIRNRLKRIEGQVRGIQRLLGEQQSCNDLLVQLGAVKQALNAVTVQLLEGHIETCVAASIKEGRGASALKELKSALAHAMKHGV